MRFCQRTLIAHCMPSNSNYFVVYFTSHRLSISIIFHSKNFGHFASHWRNNNNNNCSDREPIYSRFVIKCYYFNVGSWIECIFYSPPILKFIKRSPTKMTFQMWIVSLLFGLLNNLDLTQLIWSAKCQMTPPYWSFFHLPHAFSSTDDNRPPSTIGMRNIFRFFSFSILNLVLVHRASPANLCDWWFSCNWNQM